MTVLSAVIVATFLVALVILPVARASRLRGGIYSASAVWATSLPILATLGYALIILNSVFLTPKNSFDLIDLRHVFSVPELLILLILGGFFTTRLGQSLAALCTSLILLRVGFQPTSIFPSGFGVSLLIACSVVVLVLGDHLPWLATHSRSFRTGHVLRAAILAFLGAASIGITLLTLAKLPEFCAWTAKHFSRHLSESLASTLLCAMLIGWILALLGQMRQSLLFLLILPNLLLFAFTIGWTAPYFAVLLTLMATLAIATQERRSMPRNGIGIANQNGRWTMTI
jgi:hypothetical protein